MTPCHCCFAVLLRSTVWTLAQRCLSFVPPLRCRHPSDPAAHAALGYFLLTSGNSKNNSSRNADGVSDPEGLGNLDRAIAAFRTAMDVSQADDVPFVPATRGLAVAIRRRRLIVGFDARVERPPSRGTEDTPRNNNDGEGQQVSTAWNKV